MHLTLANRLCLQKNTRGSFDLTAQNTLSHPRDIVALGADEVLAADAQLAAVFVAVIVAELPLGASALLATAAPVRRDTYTNDLVFEINFIEFN